MFTSGTEMALYEAVKAQITFFFSWPVFIMSVLQERAELGSWKKDYGPDWC